MYAQCPDCRSVFQVSATDLAAAAARVRCGHCGAGFDALRSLSDALPEGDIDALPLHDGALPPPSLDAPVYRTRVSPEYSLFAPDQLPPSSTSQKSLTTASSDIEIPSHAPEPFSAPDFVRRRSSRRPTRNWPWVVACLILLLGLSGEIAWAERARLAGDPAIRPLFQQICEVLRCQLPMQHDASTLALVSRDIRPHPSVANALIISATLRNQAAYTQPFPVIRITLSDLDDQRIAMRRFRSGEYVADPGARSRGLAPGMDAAVVFEVADPGRDAVAFEFGFEQ
ncbi:MAG: zinc-ribbon and DUF3426 domain-containing protein [Dokdonella sp.]